MTSKMAARILTPTKIRRARGWKTVAIKTRKTSWRRRRRVKRLIPKEGETKKAKKRVALKNLKRVTWKKRSQNLSTKKETTRLSQRSRTWKLKTILTNNLNNLQLIQGYWCKASQSDKCNFCKQLQSTTILTWRGTNRCWSELSRKCKHSLSKLRRWTRFLRATLSSNNLRFRDNSSLKNARQLKPTCSLREWLLDNCILGIRECYSNKFKQALRRRFRETTRISQCLEERVLLGSNRQLCSSSKTRFWRNRISRTWILCFKLCKAGKLLKSSFNNIRSPWITNFKQFNSLKSDLQSVCPILRLGLSTWSSISSSWCSNRKSWLQTPKACTQMPLQEWFQASLVCQIICLLTKLQTICHLE